MPHDSILPHVNAGLNGIATALLVIGLILIKRGRVRSHKWVMLSCFGVSVAFLGCYLVYHIVIRKGESSRLPAYVPTWFRYGYLAMLLSHIVLAAAVPILAIVTIVFGLRDQRARHRKLAKWTFPIWLYVSVTGVLVYLVIYHIYPPAGETVYLGFGGMRWS